MNKFFATLIGLAAFAGMGYSSLAAAEGVPVVVSNDGSGQACYTLYAGRHIDAGRVCLEVSEDNLNVSYSTTGGWELNETHGWIGQSIIDLPQTKTGNPKPGRFEYVTEHDPSVTYYSIDIPLYADELAFTCPSPNVTYYLAAHAALSKANGDGSYQTETGWSDGSPITSKGNWATFSTFTLACNDPSEPPPVGEVGCETAFARYADANTSFLDIGFSRWGWTNGPLEAGSYEMDIYAGAGRSDITKGTLVGTLTLVYDGESANVTYDTGASGWWMDSTHLYVGNDRLPLFKKGKKLVETVAPGQYPAIHDDLDSVTQDIHTVTSNGEIYLVGHGVVCHYR